MSGILTDGLDRLQTMLADCKPFSDWLGLKTFNAAVAAKRIHIDGVRSDDGQCETLRADELTKLRPYCMIYLDTSEGVTISMDASPNCWSPRGRIMAQFSKAYDSRLSIHEYSRQAYEQLSKVVSNPSDEAKPGLIQMREVAGYLAFDSIQLYPFGRTPTEEVEHYGDAYDIIAVIDYGGRRR